VLLVLLLDGVGSGVGSREWGKEWGREWGREVGNDEDAVNPVPEVGAVLAEEDGVVVAGEIPKNGIE
jgi:hypothetical protein